MARKKRKKKTSTRRATASKKKRRGRPRKTDGRSRAGRLATMSTSELRAELERRQAQGHTLIARRDELVSELRDVEQQLADLGIAGGGGGGSVAAPAKRGPGRPKGSKNKPKAGPSAAAARAEADADGIDPLGGICDELDGEERGSATDLIDGCTVDSRRFARVREA